MNIKQKDLYMSLKSTYKNNINTFSYPKVFTNGDDYLELSNENLQIKPFLTPFKDNSFELHYNDEIIHVVIKYKDEPVTVLVSYDTMNILDEYMDIIKESCKQFNYRLADNELFLSYFILNHVINDDYINPVSHYLLKEVKTIEQFNALYNMYDGLYTKYRNYICNKSDIDFIKSLTDFELELFKFSMTIKTDINLNNKNTNINLVYKMGSIKENSFTDFGISDDDIESILYMKKVNIHYILSNIIKELKEPSSIGGRFVIYKSPNILSFLTKDDEVSLWRSGVSVCTYVHRLIS